MENKIYDIIGIGIGPFNLGLAALAHSVPQLNCLFIDKNETFNWHPGLLLPNATLQVPFYADLVTVANPCSPFSFLAFLKAKKRLFRFAIHENNFVKRKEYNEYCRWVISQLPNLHFNSKCDSIIYHEEESVYEVRVISKSLFTKNIVIGTGTAPYIPPFVDIAHPSILHSGNYLLHKEKLLSKKSITIVGSGQSAAEIFYDLLTEYKNDLHWLTRSQRFYPMEYSKLTLEMTSPDYIDHFYNLSGYKKQNVLSKQDMLYKGINYSLINTIYDELYDRQFDNRKIQLNTNCQLTNIIAQNNRLLLSFVHTEIEKAFDLVTDAVILATGYRNIIPSFLDPVKKYIQWTGDPSTSSGQVQYDVNRNYSVNEQENIFVQNAEMHTHGFTAPDLGMGPYRNAIILNSILGYEHFAMEKNIAFQTFGCPGCQR